MGAQHVPLVHQNVIPVASSCKGEKETVVAEGGQGWSV